MVLQGHMENKNHHISVTRVSIETKLGRMIASLNGLLPIMSHDTLIAWPCEIRSSLTGVDSARKCLSRHQLLVCYIKTINVFYKFYDFFCRRYSLMNQPCSNNLFQFMQYVEALKAFKIPS